MKLWLLRPHRPMSVIRTDGDAWDPWYNVIFGFVLRAETQAAARRLAHENAGDENRSELDPWLDPAQSTCEELTGDGPAEVILSDLHQS